MSCKGGMFIWFPLRRYHIKVCFQQKFFCPACSAIQPVDDKSFFDYLGVRPAFDIDISLLKKNFLELQSQIHPDKFSGCSKVSVVPCLEAILKCGGLAHVNCRFQRKGCMETGVML